MNDLMNSLVAQNEVTEDIAPPNSYYNEQERLYYCLSCNTPKQCRINWNGPKVVCCMCKCEASLTEAENKAQQEKNRIVDIRHARYVGLLGCLQDKTFSNFIIKDHNRKNYEICKRYAETFAEMKAENIGLRMVGSTGLGKSHLAAAIANYLIDNGYRVFMRTMDELVGDIFKSFDKNSIVADICEYDLLIIDEFGQERDTETVKQYVQDIINTRVVNGKPFIITTNVMKPAEEDMTYCDRRVYSRFNETLMNLVFSGTDMRQEIHNAKAERFKEILKGENNS